MDLETTSLFDEEWYLEQNPDVREAVSNGHYASGLEHYRQFGQVEGRQGSRSASALDGRPGTFDEHWYVEHNPDIADAIAAGTLRSGYDHWVAHGKREGRIAPPGYDEGDVFDETWYLSSYHSVAGELASGAIPDAFDHYNRLGHARGYLPNRFASRPNNPAGMKSDFGGLWPDQANALDLIAGRLETGRITPAEAILLRQWVRDGFVVLEQAIPAELVDRAAAELHRAYDGGLPGAIFECPSVGGYSPITWQPVVRDLPAKALDLHWVSPVMRELVFTPVVRSFLELIFERRALASQSLTFLRGSAQGFHQDSVYVPFSLPTQFAASWIALEDVSPGGGELTYFPGSHRLPEYLYGNRYKTLWDAQRILRTNSLREEMRDYSDRLAQRSREAGLKEETFLARKGDVLIWHADLAHGGRPISSEKTRASVVTHYCPREVASLTFERGQTAMRSFNDVAWYSTGYYAGE